MRELILLGEVDHVSETPEFQWGDETVKTEARGLVPFPEDVDEDLCELVCACCATDYEDRPTLNFLVEQVLIGCRKTAADYDDNPDEEDNAVANLWMDIIFNAPVSSNESDETDGSGWSHGSYRSDRSDVSDELDYG